MELGYESGCWYLGRKCQAMFLRPLSLFKDTQSRIAHTNVLQKKKVENSYLGAFLYLSTLHLLYFLPCITSPLPFSLFQPLGARTSRSDKAAVLPVTLCSRLIPLRLSFPGSLPLLHGLLVLGFADGGGTVLR